MFIHSPVIFYLLFSALIWNVMADIFADIISIVLQINFVILSAFRRMYPLR